MYKGLLFISPWVIGVLLFVAYPVFDSLYYSFTDYNGLNQASWIGLGNYSSLLTQDPLFWLSVRNTLYYVVVSLVLGQSTSLLFAVLMRRKIREESMYRIAYYLPSVLPSVAVTFLWIFFMDPQYGMVNTVLEWFHIHGPGWLIDPNWAKISLVLLAIWTGGQGTIIYLAALGNVPVTLYECSEIDGASPWMRFWKITIPLISPQILLNVILGVVGGFQLFTQALIAGNASGGIGNPEGSTLFYSVYLYQQAFNLFHMGYASAMAWLLCLITFVSVVLVMRISKNRVHYLQEGGIA